MFQLLKNPSFDFMKLGKPLLGVSVILMLVCAGVLFTRGLNLGIEFTGGTELQLKYRDAPDVGQIRSALAGAGLTSQSVTTIGEPDEHEVYVRLGDTESVEDGDVTSLVVRTLRGDSESDGTDLNVDDEATIRLLLEGGPDPASAEALAATISETRKEVAIFHDVSDLAGLPGMTSELSSYLESNAEFGPIAVRSQSYIGPAIGAELVQKTKVAISMSLLFMLLYIAVRFHWQWGIAAVFALLHDTLITLGLFSVFQKEMSLPVVAAFLTLVGYSVNDTVVVFDRIRENVANRPAEGLPATVNRSINHTLSRTVITSGLTLIVCLGLYFFGGGALNAFAFVLCVGVAVGTYSSVYIASPFLVLWKEFFDKKGGAGAAEAPASPAPGRTARKVPRSSSSGA